MLATTNPIIETYSQLAAKYDDEPNMRSCWGKATDDALGLLRRKMTTSSFWISHVVPGDSCCRWLQSAGLVFN